MSAQWLSTYLAYLRPCGFHSLDTGKGEWIPHTLSIKTSETAQVEELTVESPDPRLIPEAHMVEEKNQGQRNGAAT